MATPALALETHQTEFEFAAGPHPVKDLAVLGFEAEEELSRPFLLEVTLVARPGVEVDAAALIGEKGHLNISEGGTPLRFIHGIVAGR